MDLGARIPSGPLEQKWERRLREGRLVGPSNRRKYTLLVVGSGLAGASAAATLAELGYRVHCFSFHDSPRRAHSIAAQGGINAAKNYRNDGDSVWRLFYDTLKGGDFRSREANVYRLAQVSNRIIDQCVAQGVPFAREYGGLLATRSFGGALVSRTFYARGQTGQQLLLGAYQALERQISAGQVRMHPRTEMLDLVRVDGRARGIIARDLRTGELGSFAGDAVILATGGYGNIYHLSTNARGSNATAIWRAYRRGAGFANPCFTQIHPTCIPVSGPHQSKLTLMSESLRNDGRVWVPKLKGDPRTPRDIPESERDYFLERRYPTYGNLAPRDIASRAAKEICDQGRGVGPGGRGVYLDLGDAIERLGAGTIRERYGNVLEMYERITGEHPYRAPMRIYPAVHYAMGGLWVDYDLRSTLPGLYVIGEANFSDHGANRLGASALMQGLADGYFIVPNTIADELARFGPGPVDLDHPAFRDAEHNVQLKLERLLASRGTRTVEDHFRALGSLLWEQCGMARSERGLSSALESIQALQGEFERDLRLPDTGIELNDSLERAGRLADYYELAELMCRDALERRESCGAHFREEFQTAEGEARRDDEHFCHVSVWEYRGKDRPPALHKEPLFFESVAAETRSYK
ncbi:fumarate reductase/succinate dehydrogenase flavoprotein subunit [Myxococcus virescens]|uniref:succinate dehydrogenase n=1 Tax=Myxococcus virescens TaxID=83456 RepID=A0A511HI39_9BACT|nr:fumarate reductase/succinate dehydrogenase flavoprotein subunit [Myxococcus virescens]GEL73232.1 succinate dehydrogenase flavoprotein subunit [Myxococcus virescens]SDE56175.1 succinate dehydrogenase subunit A [Myxococcus virescens]